MANPSVGAKWLTALADSISDRAETPTEGYLTCEQIAIVTGKSVSTVRHLVKKMGDKVDMQVFRIHTGRRLLPVPHYRPKP